MRVEGDCTESTERSFPPLNYRRREIYSLLQRIDKVRIDPQGRTRGTTENGTRKSQDPSRMFRSTDAQVAVCLATVSLGWEEEQ